MRVRAAPKEHYGWFTAQTGYAVPGDFRAIEAVDSRGAVRGMVGFDGWTPASVRMHMALGSPIYARHLLEPAFDYPFNQEGRAVVVGMISEANPRSLFLARRLGFSDCGRVRDGWAPGEDIVILELRRENCRFLAGQRKAA